MMDLSLETRHQQLTGSESLCREEWKLLWLRDEPWPPTESMNVMIVNAEWKSLHRSQFPHLSLCCCSVMSNLWCLCCTGRQTADRGILTWVWSHPPPHPRQWLYIPSNHLESVTQAGRVGWISHQWPDRWCFTSQVSFFSLFFLFVCFLSNNFFFHLLIY